MKVQVLNEASEILWERGETSGIACRGYVASGMQNQIVGALKSAVEQAEAELLLFDVVDRVLGVGGSAS